MKRRRFLAAAVGGSAALASTGWSVQTGRAKPTGATPRAGRGAEDRPPATVAWWRTYGVDPMEEGFAAAAPAHGGGHVLVGPAHGMGRSEDRAWLVRIRRDGSVVRQRTLLDGRVTGASDVVRTADGYAVATGASLAVLDAAMAVEATGHVEEYASLGPTKVVELPDGFAVAGAESTSSTVTAWVAGFDPDGTVRWTRAYETTYQLSFALPWSGGCVVGGTRTGRYGGQPWLVSIAPDGAERWKTTVTAARWGAGNAVRTGEGITLLGGGGLVRLDETRSVVGHRPYDVFETPDVYGTSFAPTADGGFVVARHDDSGHVHVARTNADGTRRWTREYGDGSGVDPTHRVSAVTERRPGEYLLVGRQRTGDWDGWAAVLVEEPAPTSATGTEPPARTPPAVASPTPSPAATPVSTPPSTATASPRTDRAPSPRSSTTDSPATGPAIPGFGAATALGAAVGATLLSRWRDR